jgi:hypothetical protein
VAARAAIGIKDRMAYLRRLSVVFAVELRLRIVTELYMREMSPKQFGEEFGGGSVSRVTKNFEKLEEHGWLRYLRSEGPGGSRRGGVEHFYRAPELAVFDDETWALLPHSIRVVFSWTTFKQLVECFRHAMEAGTFDARPDRHNSCDSLLLDRRGWNRVIAAVEAFFVSCYDEQNDVKLRLQHSGEKPMIAGVSLVAFESPLPCDEQTEPCLVEADDSHIPFPLRLSRILRDELCLRIVEEMNQREMSVAQFCRETGSPYGAARSRFKLMEDSGWVKRTRAKTNGKRRNGKEIFFRAAGPALFDNGPWSDVPRSVEKTDSWKTFEWLSEQAKEAMRAGTFDARTDRCLTWSLLLLDRPGWEKLIAEINALYLSVLNERDEARDRMARSGERPIAMTIGLSAFEAPADSKKEL